MLKESCPCPILVSQVVPRFVFARYITKSQLSNRNHGVLNTTYKVYAELLPLLNTPICVGSSGHGHRYII